MSKADISAVERIVANTINETARGDPDALATRALSPLSIIRPAYSHLPPSSSHLSLQEPWPSDYMTRHRPLFEQVQLHLAANGLRIARGTIPKRGFSAFSKVALICRPAIRDTNAEGHLYRLI
jgi:hypothetical protein